MDFNKEEAARARGIAMEKLRNNDFGTARRIALRAQKLDSELGNLSNILSICDVHCAAENKINGKEMDWYGILQLQQTGDESLIKKQYHKLALLLHPDKNQCPGAAAAFKLIGEARMVLLDQSKRVLHDSVRSNNSAATSHPASCQSEKPCTVRKSPMRKAHLQRKTNAKNSERVSFWTECTLCGYKNDFIVGKLGEPFMCHTCEKSFIPRIMSLGTRSCSKPITPDELKCIDEAAWYEIFGLDKTKMKGSKKRRAGGCKSSGKGFKKQCKTSNKASQGCKADAEVTNSKTKVGAQGLLPS